MAIAIGQQLGSYEVTELLGKGGMGEVYRARDSKLKRDVAIKILPDEFSRDADRVCRFQREAEVLASLSHANIAAIFDLQEINGTRFLVLELVEGETLADRIVRGPFAIDDALNIAKQICEGLEAAHERGVIHRDLKPGNIKILSDGKVKILDFGLAKAFEYRPPSALSNSPTLMASIPGVILGTAAYMSPEQARGFPADPRADVFAFGCVLYEMLTGKQAFQGDTVSDVLASVLKTEPDFALLPRDITPALRHVLRRSLEKNPKRRWYAIGDVRVELDTVSDPNAHAIVNVTVRHRPNWKRAIPFLLTALVGAGITAAVLVPRRPVNNMRPARFGLVLPESQRFTRVGRQVVTVSPDGTNIVYVANNQLYLRTLDDVTARPIQGSALDPDSPFFSPDGQWVAFHSAPEGKLKKIPITGGASVTICDSASPMGASWAIDDQIYMGGGTEGVLRVAASGGKPETVIAVKSGEAVHGPQLLPDGETLLFTLGKTTTGPDASRWDSGQIVTQSLKSGQRKILKEGGSDARYLITGHIVYAVGSTILAVPFDVKTLQITGGPVPVIEDVFRATGGNPSAGSDVAFSDTGVVVFVPSSFQRNLTRALVMADRSGMRKPLPIPPGSYFHPRISPDGKHFVVGTNDGKEAAIWIYDLDGTTAMRRLTFEGANRYPLWSKDGQRIVFQSDRDKDLGLFWQSADGSGSAERVTKAENGIEHIPNAWTDPKTLLLTLAAGTQGRLAISMVGNSQPKDLFQIPSDNISEASVSPDGHWITYHSADSGRNQIYVQPFPPTGATKYQLTTDVGMFPIWSPDGKQIFYSLQPGGGVGVLMAIDVQTRPTFSFGKPVPIPVKDFFYNGSPGAPRSFDITPDGKQFLIMISTADLASSQPQTRQIYVMLNWFEELKRRGPVK